MDITELDKLVKAALDEIDDGDSFEELPDDNYEVKCIGMELTESKSGSPMIKLTFKVVQGTYTDRYIWIYYTLLKKDGTVNGYGIKNGLEFLRSLGSCCAFEWDGVEQLKTDLLDCYEDITATDPKEYLLNIESTKGKNGDTFKNYEIVEIYNV